jgi:DNA polymerase
MRREDVFIANVLKCRPPGNRDPQPAEIEACSPYLHKQVELIQPKVVGTLGNFATKLLTGSRTGITKVRGTTQVHVLGGRAVYIMPLLHPAAALRTPSLVDTLREDFAKFPELLATPSPQEVEEARRASEQEVAVGVGSDESDQLDLLG